MVDESYKILNENEDLSVSQKRENWDIAIGLQKVDNLRVSDYLIDLSEANINGKINSYEVYENINNYYKTTEQKSVKESEKEADLVSAKINLIINSGGFSFSPITLQNIHKTLFEDINNQTRAYHPGSFRTENISKSEPILGGKSVVYGDFTNIKSTLEYDFNSQKQAQINSNNIVEKISKFTSDIWQVHPFYEGNTRTTAVFIIKYLQTFNLKITNEVFKNNSLYFRNALVRANYADIQNDINHDFTFLNKFFESVINGIDNKFDNNELYVVKNSSVNKQKSLDPNGEYAYPEHNSVKSNEDVCRDINKNNK